jgi:hypothetical protein
MEILEKYYNPMPGGTISRVDFWANGSQVERLEIMQHAV